MFGRNKNKNKSQERTSSGQPVYRHQAIDPATGVAPPDMAVRQALDAHLQSYFGEQDSTYGEVVSDKVQLSVLIWNPTPDRPMYTLVTQGMSDLPMTLPNELIAQGAPQRAELMLCLPPDWKMASESNPQAWDDETAYFPVRFMKTIARIPHEYDTWIGFGHTIPNGDPPEPFTDATKLCGWLMLTPLTVPEGFESVSVDGVGEVAILSMVGLYPDEMQQKLDQGVESLFENFQRLEVSELLDLDRPSAAS